MQEEESRKPLKSEFVPTGHNQGISYAVWIGGISIQKRTKKSDNDKWETVQVLNLSKRQLEEFRDKIPKFLELMKSV